MKRAWILVLLAAVVGCGGFAQTKKSPKAAPRQELSPPPVTSAGAPVVPAHPNPYNVYSAQYPRIEADNRATFHFIAPNAQKVSSGTTHEWQTWRRSFYTFAQLLFK